MTQDDPDGDDPDRDDKSPWRRVSEFTLQAPTTSPRADNELVASREEANHSRGVLTSIVIIAGAISIAIIVWQAGRWDAAGKRAEDYAVLRAEQQRLAIALKEPRPNIGATEVGSVQRQIDDLVSAAQEEGQWRRSWFVIASTLLGIAIGLTLAYVGLKQYHQYRAAMQDLIWGRLQAQRLADEAAQAAQKAKDEKDAKQRQPTLEESTRLLRGVARAIQAQTAQLEQLEDSVRALTSERSAQTAPGKPGGAARNEPNTTPPTGPDTGL